MNFKNEMIELDNFFINIKLIQSNLQTFLDRKLVIDFHISLYS